MVFMPDFYIEKRIAIGWCFKLRWIFLR